MASIGENIDCVSSSGGTNSPKQAIMERQRNTELPHLQAVRVGGGLRVSIRTSGTPTPSCVTDGGLRSHSTKLLLERSRDREQTSPVKRHCSAQLARSTSHLVSEHHTHTHTSSGVLMYVHSPTHLGTYAEKKASKLSGALWSPNVSVEHKVVLESKTNSQGKGEQCGCISQGSKHNLLTKRDLHQRSLSFNCGRGKTLLSREQAPPTCRRRVLTDYERNLTFKPKLNHHSLRIASRNSRNTLPLINRLSEVRKNQLPHYDQEHLTFAPKLNPLSLKLAHERASKMPEVQARQAQQTAARLAEANSNCTFKPQVSERSQRIAQGLGTDFLTRQQRHLAKKGQTHELALSKSPTRPAPSTQSPTKRPIKLKPRALPLAASQPSPHEADSAKAASCTTSPRRSSLSDSSRTSFGEEGMANNETTPTTPTNACNIRPASCTPTKRHKPETRQEKVFSNSKTPQVGKNSQSEHGHRRTNSAGGGKETHGSSLKKITGAVGGSSSKKIEALLTARFERLSDVDRVRRVKMNSEKLMKSKRVFLIRGGYRRIRKCLRKRGWVEQDYYKNSIKSTNNGGTTCPKKPIEITCLSGCGKEGSSDDDSDGDTDVNDGGAVSEEEYSDEEEYCMLSRAVRNCVPNFVWTLKRDDVLFRGLTKDSMVNHFAKASSFTTKVGLCTNLRNLLWFGDTDPDTFFPRCYRLSCDEEKATFIEDYRFTAALCILKMLSQRSSNPHPCVGNSLPEAHTVPEASPSSSSTDNTETKVVRPPPPEVPEEATQLAVKAAEAFLGSVDHNDIEGSQYQLCPKLTASEWDKLIHHFYSLAFENGQLRSSIYMCCKASDLLDEVAQHYPQLHMDGIRNVWIIKPGASSRGRGIMCMDRLEPILELVSSTVVKNAGKWVIQKYIERPLLLFDTKFDIRQWFLVTDWNPLTMWMYKECYLRFSTQKYTLENLDQSIHLCNNSIQKHYSNDELRANALPEDNMWDSNTFQDHLSASGHSKLWESTIYPGMKQALIHVLQVAQDEIEHRKNSFELYGADFMLSSDYHPWLIEINCSPAMESSTSVTARLCRQVLEDTLKVVLDHREDKDCDIGGFELAYKQPKHEVPNYVGIQLCVQGYAVPKPRSYNYIRKTVSNTSDPENLGETPASNSSPVHQVANDSKVISEENRTTCSQNSKTEISDSKVASSDPKIARSSSSAPSIKSSVSTPTSPLRTDQTSLSCGTDASRSRPGTCVNIVEINCKLPNTNLRVS